MLGFSCFWQKGTGPDQSAAPAFSVSQPLIWVALDPNSTAQNDNALANRKGQAAILLKTRKIRNNRPDQANIAAATVAAENQPQKKTTNFNISLTI